MPADTRLYGRLRRSGFAYLQRYAATEARFRAVMARRIDRWQRAGLIEPGGERSGDLIARLLDDFRALGLLDDAAFAEGRAVSLRRRGLSARRLVLALRQKGVDAETAGAALAVAGIAEDVAALLAARRRRIGPFRRRLDAGRDEIVREVAILVRQGYAHALARAVVTMTAEDAEARLAEAG